ncbi:MAG: hypothetical protein ACREFP_10765 [Acetobacteraceae bacterium]
MLSDFVYEGARAIVGPYLATFGAWAALVGFITGFGEAVALVLRLATGRISDRAQLHWALSIARYAIITLAASVLALPQTLCQTAVLIILERFGKAVRTPARDTMLALADTRFGRGTAFAVHEALGQSGALLGLGGRHDRCVWLWRRLRRAYRIGSLGSVDPGLVAPSSSSARCL